MVAFHLMQNEVKKVINRKSERKKQTQRIAETERLRALNLDDFFTSNANPSRDQTAHPTLGSVRLPKSSLWRSIFLRCSISYR